VRPRRTGSVAQWLGRWSLVGELFLPFERSVFDIYHFVGKLSAMGHPTK